MRSSRDERLSGHDAKGFSTRGVTRRSERWEARPPPFFFLSLFLFLFLFFLLFFCQLWNLLPIRLFPFYGYWCTHQPSFFFSFFMDMKYITRPFFYLLTHFFLRLRNVRPFLWPITNDSESRSYTKRGHRECLCRSFSRRAPSDRTTGDSDSAGDIDDLVKSTHSARNQTLMINFI